MWWGNGEVELIDSLQITSTLAPILFASNRNSESSLVPSQLDTHRKTQIDPLAKLLRRIGVAVGKQQQKSGGGDLRRIRDMLVSIDAGDYAAELRDEFKMK